MFVDKLDFYPSAAMILSSTPSPSTAPTMRWHISTTLHPAVLMLLAHTVGSERDW
jgi:hypothetical protein